MKTVPFAIDVRVPQRCIEVAAEGDVSQEDRLTAIEEVCDLLRENRDFAVLVDLRACPRTPTTAETYAVVSALVARAPFLSGGAALLVRPGPPHGMACLEQLLVRQAGVSIGVFTDRAEAERWLATDPHPVAPAPR
ncbi:MAG TPA: hypothetical protein VFQ38_07390 [Longimicrobiales bacterium]|nr:hypothetical protein [Longimicrobiales bacterium]